MTIALRFDFGDVVLVPFPFTDQSGTKKRPAVVVSIVDYNTSRRDIVIMAITSQVRAPLGYGEAMVDDWQGAGLIKASVLKPVFSTIEQGLVVSALDRKPSPTGTISFAQTIRDVSWERW